MDRAKKLVQKFTNSRRNEQPSIAADQSTHHSAESRLSSTVRSDRRDRNSEINRKRISFFLPDSGSDSGFADQPPSAIFDNSAHLVSDRTASQRVEAVRPLNYSQPERRPPAEQLPVEEPDALAEDRHITAEQSDVFVEHSRTPTEQANVTCAPNDRMSSNKSEIALVLSGEPQNLGKELEIFETLAAGERLSDSQRVIKLYTAIQKSKFNAKMASIIDPSHLASYDQLKGVLMKAIQVDPNALWNDILNPNHQNPLAAYNMIRLNFPHYNENEILTFLKPHLPLPLYLTWKTLDFDTESVGLKQRIINLINAVDDSGTARPIRGDSGLQANSEILKRLDATTKALERLGVALDLNSSSTNTSTIAQVTTEPDGIAQLNEKFDKLLELQINNISNRNPNNNSSGHHQARQSDLNSNSRNSWQRRSWDPNKCSFHNRFDAQADKCRGSPCSMYSPQYCIPDGRGAFARSGTGSMYNRTQQYQPQPYQPQPYQPYAYASSPQQPHMPNYQPNYQVPVQNNPIAQTAGQTTAPSPPSGQAVLGDLTTLMSGLAAVGRAFGGTNLNQ